MQIDSLDTELMQLVANGDQIAFATLVKKHLPKAHVIARRMLNSAQDAEEASQDAFSKVWINAVSFDKNKSSFGTWFYRILVNSCLDLSRRKPKASLDIELVKDSLADDKPDAEYLLLEKRESEIIRRAVQALPKKQRIAIILCYYEEFTNQQASDIMGLNIKALEGLLFRARSKLKILLGNI